MTGKQARFCEEYILDFNATQAAIRAGYSPKTAHQIGCENLKKPEVQARIKAFQSAARERNKVTLDGLIADLKRLRDEAFENKSYGAVKGSLDLMGRMIGAYSNRIEATARVTPNRTGKYSGRDSARTSPSAAMSVIW